MTGKLFHAARLGGVFRSLSFFTFLRGAACVGREEKYVEIDTRLCWTFSVSRDYFWQAPQSDFHQLPAHWHTHWLQQQAEERRKALCFRTEEVRHYVCFLSCSAQTWIHHFQTWGVHQFYQQLPHRHTKTSWRNNFKLVWTFASWEVRQEGPHQPACLLLIQSF